MKKILFGIAVLCLVTSVGYCQEKEQPLADKTAPLVLTLKSDKQVYEAGEPINLELSVHNNSKETIQIYSPEYWGVSEIFVKKATGEVVQSQFFTKVKRVSFDTFASIASQGIRSFLFKDLEWFGCGGLSGFNIEKDFSPGIYNLYMTVKNPPVCAGAKYLETDLSGILTSNPLTIEVKAKKEISPAEADQKKLDYNVGVEDATGQGNVRVSTAKAGVDYKMSKNATVGVQASQQIHDSQDAAAWGGADDDETAAQAKYKLSF